MIKILSTNSDTVDVRTPMEISLSYWLFGAILG